MTTNLNVVLTSKGARIARLIKSYGWYFNITSFGYSENIGNLNENREISNINTMFVNPLIGGVVPISDYTQELLLGLPPNALNPSGTPNTSNKNIGEMYLFAETQSINFTVDLLTNEIVMQDNFLYNQMSTGEAVRFQTTGTLPLGSTNLQAFKTFFIIKSNIANRFRIATSIANANSNIPISIANIGIGTHTISYYFLLIVGQFSPEPLLYNYTGGLLLRVQLTIDNFKTANIKFLYTQAYEIDVHNHDPNAHPEIQKVMQFNGTFVNDLNFIQNGQNYIKDVIKDVSVTNYSIVYKKTDGIYYPALATTGDVTKFAGIYFPDGSIRTSGVLHIPLSVVTGSPINSDLYLSDSVAGNITTNITPYPIGRHLGNGNILVKSSSGSSNVNYLTDLLDVRINSPIENQVLIKRGVNFVNDVLNLSDLGDVDLITNLPINKNFLRFNSANKWIPVNVGIGDLSGVVLTNVQNNDYLINNGTNWINSPINFEIKRNTTSIFAKGLQFSNNFSVSLVNGLAVLDYTGGTVGATTFLGLNDVPDAYPINMGGIVVFDNYTSNISTNKIKLIGIDTDINDPVFYGSPDGTGGSIFTSVYKSISNIFKVVPSGLSGSIYIDYSGLVLTNDHDGLNYKIPSILIRGSSSNITNAINNKGNKTVLIEFGSGFIGNLSNGVLTLNTASGGSSGLSSVQNASSLSGNAYKPLVYNTGVGGLASIRGLKSSTSININMINNNGSIVTALSDATSFEISANYNIYNKSFYQGSSSPVYTVVGNDLTNILAYGIRGTGGITISMESALSDPTQKNIVISGTGGGGTSGITLNSVNDAHSGSGISITNASNALDVRNSINGIYSFNNSYGSFFQSSTIAGAGFGNNVVGIELRADNKTQISFQPKYPLTNSSNSLLTYPNVGDFNMFGASQLVNNNQTNGSGFYNNDLGLYLFTGTYWQQVQLGQQFRTSP